MLKVFIGDWNSKAFDRETMDQIFCKFVLNHNQYFKIDSCMNPVLNANEILSRIKRLNKVDQLALLEKVTLLVRETKKSSTQTKLSDISGVGSSVWHNTNIDEYVDGERQW